MSVNNRNRRYYIHSKLKNVLTIDAHNRQVLITDAILESLDNKTKVLLFELRDKFKYNLQYTIPA